MTAARSSNGCWTCRVRKKKCLEERPVCSTCDSLHITCHGYGQKPAWMDGGKREKAEVECIKRAIKSYKHKRRIRTSSRGGKQLPLLVGGSLIESGSHQNKSQPSLTESSPVEATRPSFSTVRSTFEAPASSWPPSPAPHDHPLVQCLPIVEVATHRTPRAKETDPTHEPYLSTCLSCGLTRSLHSYNGRETNLLMHYLDIVFPLQFRFYSPLVSEGGRGWLLSILLRTKPLFHAALSLSAYHQSSTLPGASETHGNSSTLADLDRHYSLTIVELRRHIDGLGLEIGLGSMATRVEILACMIQLVSFEVFRGGNHDWQTHLQAARALFMEIKGSFSTPRNAFDPRHSAMIYSQHPGNETGSLASLPSDEALALNFFASALVWFDILSSVTTGEKPRYPDVFSSLLQVEDGSIQLCQLMGCKNWVMVIIMDIAILAEWKSAAQSCGNLSLLELARRAASIEARLKTGIAEHLEQPLDPTIDSCGIRTLESRYVTHIFACAAQVYLHVVVSGAYPEISEIKEGVKETLEAFRSLPDARWSRHLVWPFCIAGCMAEEQYEDDFRSIASTANMDGGVFCNFEKALAIMEECWRGRRGQRSHPWSWTTAMTSLGVKALLI